MKNRLLHRIRDYFGDLKLNRKIQLSLILIIVPLFGLFAVLFFNIYGFNQSYDHIIANASEAGRFSIKFKEEFDYKIYLLIAGHSSFSAENPYKNIDQAREIASDLINNTSMEDNKRRAESIMKLLNNLEKYVKNIEQNKVEGGHYDDNFQIWESDVQTVTALIQSTMLEYVYYETKGMSQVREQVSQSLERITLFSIIVFALLTILALLLSVVIPNSIAKPIQYFSSVTNQVAMGDLSVRVHSVRGAEVKKLAVSLNTMIEKTEDLLAAVQKDQTSLREAELELLQAQINPHFLYNTLDTIIWLAEAGKQGEVVEIVGSLSDFFRTSLNHGNGMFMLREEEKHVHSYLQIQQVRYRDILDYQINIPEELGEVVIPKITLQPLVENALYHGIKNRRGRGMIHICAEAKDNDVSIVVEDNGIGMTAERLAEVTAQLKAPEASGAKQKHDSYGLFNVNERIKLKFGDKYGISIASTYGEGTQIRILIPFQRSES
ncbi:sensor histidine kinase [Acetanaerobacterium elongatum]|uniref:Two-component system, sensor histidine kinase YesM n=1 Tax=Acetanaerobacterium elongatum TaxID=258515 RepID=A0A1H0D0F7_9FIRM|nr:sensor histidine kinase [Acetanaerobacterium elongatum]SDN63657.1 two-component system, sensor histidine kinase YesM [Acetanaerobacterium elongatum]